MDFYAFCLIHVFAKPKREFMLQEMMTAFYTYYFEAQFVERR